MIVADFQEVAAGRTPEVAVSESPGMSVEETWKQGREGCTGRTPGPFYEPLQKQGLPQGWQTPWSPSWALEKEGLMMWGVPHTRL